MVQIVYNQVMSNLRLDFAPEKTQGLPELLYISYSKYEEDWSSIMHSHSFTEFLYIADGKGEVLTRHNNIPLTSGDFVVLPPGLYHTEKSSSSDSMEYFVLGVSNIVLRDYSISDAFNPVLPLAHYSSKVGNAIKKIFNLLQKGTISSEVEVYSIFLDIIATLMVLPSSPFLLKETTSQNGQMVALKDYIDTHYMETFSLDDLAHHFHLSKFHLVREFSRCYSLSPMAYLEDRRIREAKYLLSASDLPVTAIASTLAFSSTSYFSQRFKASIGLTPLEYRKQKTKQGK